MEFGGGLLGAAQSPSKFSPVRALSKARRRSAKVYWDTAHRCRDDAGVGQERDLEENSSNRRTHTHHIRQRRHLEQSGYENDRGAVRAQPLLAQMGHPHPACRRVSSFLAISLHP